MCASIEFILPSRSLLPGTFLNKPYSVCITIRSDFKNRLLYVAINTNSLLFYSTISIAIFLTKVLLVNRFQRIESNIFFNK